MAPIFSTPANSPFYCCLSAPFFCPTSPRHATPRLSQTRASAADFHLREDQSAATHADHVAIPRSTTDYSSYTSAEPLLANPNSLHSRIIQESRTSTIFHPPFISVQAEESSQELFLAAELRLLADAAADRAEMHSMLAQQRDNWNKLFQRMVTYSSMTACLLSGLDSSIGHSMSLSLPALLLNAGTAVMTAVVNQFQPSQLAEEQRSAARLFRKLKADIEYALNVSPRLHQSSVTFFNDCKRRVNALDKAFPMPLFPGCLEKFPSKVVPPIIRETDLAHVGNQEKHYQLTDHASDYNGWDRQLICDLMHAASMIHDTGIPKYISWAQNLVKINKGLATAAPCFAASAALLNFMSMQSSLPAPNTLGMWAAVCSVLATFASSFSNDLQLGMIFELYRNSAGYYADIEAAIREMLRMPVEHRENGILFRQRIAYQLGRWPASQADPLVPADAEEAGTLF